MSVLLNCSKKKELKLKSLRQTEIMDMSEMKGADGSGVD